jgi:hypothetical protein
MSLSPDRRPCGWPGDHIIGQLGTQKQSNREIIFAMFVANFLTLFVAEFGMAHFG